MSSLDRKYKAGGGEEALLLTLLFALVGVPTILYVVASAGHALTPRANPLPTGYWERSLGVFTGEAPWRTTETVLAATVGLFLTGLFALWGWKRHQKAKKVVKHDRAAPRMASVRDVAPFTEKQARAKAARFGVEVPGVMIGKMVRGGHTLYASWEDTLLHIWGTRTGKTTSQAAPSIIEAPGPVIATSNKRDLSDLTRDLRAENGDVWVFDPQGVAGEAPTWWWNPLSYVTDSERAAEMANNFATGSRPAGAKMGDAHFDSAGKDLLAGLLLAAACGGEPIERVHYWLTRSTDDTPAKLLDAAGWSKEADSVASTIRQPEKYRGSVYSTALQMAACLKNEKIAAWVNPTGPDDDRPQFDPKPFVAGKHTLYALSKEGAGTAGPLVTALTVATVTAAEEHAVTQAGGRLATPMVCVLDEAANVCRWANLPDLYSHYGSRGIVVSTFLQSWSQGVDVWGESGMKKLFSTANVVTYGGNVKEEGFLKMLSELIGKYTYTSVSSSRQKDSGSTSRQDATDDILSVADLAAMPKGRAVMLGSGTRAVLLRTVPVSARPYAEAAAASEAAHNTPAKVEPVPELQAAEPSPTKPTGNRWAALVKE
ncbi:conjugal transfer protein [Kocuria rosea subsp. polaris]|uniref:Conjugal transfer protein n=1 Tax=Kocuria rosea subsp. polaris TaxID=136273 RepID=A0A0W8I6G2_KOCRO|nr:type IV secretory system conjugative DNA transfer family protein [Kocuria polaris]KUG53848.1 conjugal transfer protein [Kocuria polaris]